jgi:hypothetical protein
MSRFAVFAAVGIVGVLLGGAARAADPQSAQGSSTTMHAPVAKPFGTLPDGRTVILGTKGYIELRKYLDVARDKTGDNVYIVDETGERHVNVTGQVGFRFFGQLILDCLNRTETAMTQAHAFKAAELCLRAQLAARRIS